MEQEELRELVEETQSQLASARAQLRSVEEEFREVTDRIQRESSPDLAFDAAAALDAALEPLAGETYETTRLATTTTFADVETENAFRPASGAKIDETPLGLLNARLLTIFSGPKASLTCVFNIDASTTFGVLLHQVQTLWKLESADVALEANISPDRGYYTPWSFGSDEGVLEHLERLKYDSSRGMGRSNMKISEFATDMYLLPPLYLVLRRRSRPGSESLTGSRKAVEGMTREDAQSMVDTGVRLQLLRRLFAEEDEETAAQYQMNSQRGDETPGLITFEGMQNTVHAYFEGFFFDRASLGVLFENEAKLFPVARNTKVSGAAHGFHGIKTKPVASRERFYSQLSSTQTSLATTPFLNNRSLSSHGRKGSMGGGYDSAYSSAEESESSDGESEVDSVQKKIDKKRAPDVNDDNYRMLEFIDFDACARIIRHLSPDDDINPMRTLALSALAAFGVTPAKAEPIERMRHAVFDSSGALNPGRVFAWMLESRGHQTDQDEIGSRPQEDQLDVETLHQALQGAFVLEKELAEEWWISDFQCGPDQSIGEREFAAGWTSLRDRPCPASSMGNVLVGDLVQRVLLAADHERLAQSTAPEAGPRATIDHARSMLRTIMTLIFLGLIYAVVYLEAQPDIMNRVSRQYMRELLRSDMYCSTFNTTSNELLEDSIPTAFSEISRPGCVWGFVKGPLQDLYYLHASRVKRRSNSSAQNQAGEGFWKTLMYNRFVPEMVTLRQLAVKKSRCSEYYCLLDQDRDCYGPYNTENRLEETLEFNTSRLPGDIDPELYEPARLWKSSSENSLMDSIKGQFAMYDGSGYVFQLGKLDGDGDLTARIDASIESWNTSVESLHRLEWIQPGMRAFVINIGLINPNLKLYTNLQILFEFADSAVVASTLSCLSFDVTVNGSRLVPTVLRGVLFFLLITTFIAQTALAYKRELVGNSANSYTSRDATDANVDENEDSVDGEGKEEAEDHRTRFCVDSVHRVLAHWWQIVYDSKGLVFVCVIIVWVAASIGFASAFRNNEVREVFARNTPTEAWNGIQLWREFVRTAHFDCVTLILLTCHAVGSLQISTRVSLALVLVKKAAPFLVLLALIMYLLLSVFASFVLAAGFSIDDEVLPFGSTFVLALASANHFGAHLDLYEDGHSKVSSEQPLGFDSENEVRQDPYNLSMEYNVDDLASADLQGGWSGPLGKNRSSVIADNDLFRLGSSSDHEPSHTFQGTSDDARFALGSEPKQASIELATRSRAKDP
ncbi:Polycystin-2 [Hondaea fermentalgiana]|uniref:Polycystin-2 n=1 Tax=Hondaea fermentalgiana TaxID=2315210 RepID=A0A2R5GMR0_9STRA|nr:Polycystin-2 [Hondaea fermentalgiana]|eukprot:GBG32176.1 Polycystin-2 [Hondaea fermentalgiana]